MCVQEVRNLEKENIKIMARKAEVSIAFAAWGRQDYPQIMDEMKKSCDFSFDTPHELEKFLFEEFNNEN